MDLKSKIDSLSTEFDTILQNKNTEVNKRKLNENRVLELESQLESSKNLYNELASEFEIFEVKISELEQKEQEYINMVRI